MSGTSEKRFCVVEKLESGEDFRDDGSVFHVTWIGERKPSGFRYRFGVWCSEDVAKRIRLHPKWLLSFLTRKYEGMLASDVYQVTLWDNTVSPEYQEDIGTTWMYVDRSVSVLDDLESFGSVGGVGCDAMQEIVSEVF